MKQIFYLTSFLISFLSFSPLIHAANLTDGAYFSLDVGRYMRRVEENCPQCVDVFGNPISTVYGNGDSTRVLANLGIRTGLWDFYLNLGGSTLTINDFDNFDGGMAPAVGGGLKVIIFESPTPEHFTLYLNPDVIYFKTSSSIQIFSFSQGLITENDDITWLEYTLKAAGSARFGLFDSYAGISLSGVSGQESGGIIGTLDLKGRDLIGLFLGTDFYFDRADRISLFGEIGQIGLNDDTFFKVGLRARF